MKDLTSAAILAWVSVITLFIGIDLLRDSHNSFIRSLTLKETGESTWQRLAETVGPAISTWLPIFNMDEIEQKLILAGRPFGLTAAGFVGIKFLALAAGVLMGLFFIAIGLPVALLIISSGLLYILPDSILRSSVDKRRKKIYKNFPSLIGLLSTALNAGVELGPALEAVGNKFPGPLGDEMRLAWREMATGRPRAAALRAMAKRTGVDSVIRFFETIIAAEERGGVDLSAIIENFRVELIESQKRQVSEQAKKVPTKMLLPMFVCIFIPTLILILVPVMINLFDVL